MIDILVFISIFALLGVVVVWVLPRSPRWVAVSFWAVFGLLSVLDNDAFFAALYAVIATNEFHTHDR